MKNFSQLVMFFFSVLLLTSCNKLARQPEVLPENIQLNGVYYTQFALQFEKGHFRTTNYRTGTLLPINAKVTLLDINKKIIKVKIEDFQHELIVKNAPKHVGGDAYFYFDKLFAQQKVNLAQFTREERAFIEKGKVGVGMRKDAVIAAFGYPPSHATPSLSYDNWTYWKSSWGDRLVVNFKDDKVVKVVD
jgi:hypothetical protein